MEFWPSVIVFFALYRLLYMFTSHVQSVLHFNDSNVGFSEKQALLLANVLCRPHLHTVRFCLHMALNILKSLYNYKKKKHMSYSGHVVVILNMIFRAWLLSLVHLAYNRRRNIFPEVSFCVHLITLPSFPWRRMWKLLRKIFFDSKKPKRKLEIEYGEGEGWVSFEIPKKDFELDIPPANKWVKLDIPPTDKWVNIYSLIPESERKGLEIISKSSSLVLQTETIKTDKELLGNSAKVELQTTEEQSQEQKSAVDMALFACTSVLCVGVGTLVKDQSNQISKSLVGFTLLAAPILLAFSRASFDTVNYTEETMRQNSTNKLQQTSESVK